MCTGKFSKKYMFVYPKWHLTINAHHYNQAGKAKLYSSVYIPLVLITVKWQYIIMNK